MFAKVDGFISVYNGTKNFVLFSRGKYYAIFNRIRYVIWFRSEITYVDFFNYSKIKIDSDDDLPPEKSIDSA